MTLREPAVYGLGAPFYDRLSGEGLLYRAGRERGIAALGLRAGETVLDVGCGTGLDVPLLAAGVGPRGHVVGIDRSAAMLDVADRRARAAEPTVTLLRGDATDAGDPAWTRAAELGPTAVLFTYSLSVMRPWQEAWRATTTHLPSGTRVAVVDMALPDGTARLLTPAARVACWLGGADPQAHPWQALERECDVVLRERLRGGHLRVVAGRLP